ncbi:MAG: SDR family NAD(P)-dependent oxidoreductase [Acetobacteraceae bacterium]
MDLSGKRVVVMGGSRGIGRAIALGSAQQGAAVAICARGLESLEAAREEIAAAGVAAYASSVDLADAAAIARFVPEAAGRPWAGSTCWSTTPPASAWRMTRPGGRHRFRSI